MNGGAMRLEQAGECVDIAHIILRDQYLAPFQQRIPIERGRQHRLLPRGQIGDHLMQKQRHFIEQPLGRLSPLDDDRLGITAQAQLFLGRQIAAGIDDHRREGEAVIAAQLFQ